MPWNLVSRLKNQRVTDQGDRQARNLRKGYQCDIEVFQGRTPKEGTILPVEPVYPFVADPAPPDPDGVPLPPTVSTWESIESIAENLPTTGLPTTMRHTLSGESTNQPSDTEMEGNGKESGKGIPTTPCTGQNASYQPEVLEQITSPGN